jgi:hypothetical protein
LENPLKLIGTIFEAIRGIAAVGISTLPIFLSSVFGDVNPTIIKRIWWVALLLSLASASIFYVLIRRASSNRAVILCGLVLLLLCLASALAIFAVAGDVLQASSAVTGFFIRASLVVFFVTFAGCLSLFVGQVMTDWAAALQGKA